MRRQQQESSFDVRWFHLTYSWSRFEVQGLKTEQAGKWECHLQKDKAFRKDRQRKKTDRKNKLGQQTQLQLILVMTT